MRSFVIGLSLLFALFTLVGALEPPQAAVVQAAAPAVTLPAAPQP